MTRDDESKPCDFRKRLKRIVELRRPQFGSLSDLTLQAGLSKGTVTNGLRSAEAEGREPYFDLKTLKALAGVGRVSLSWLEGTGADMNASDVPPPPTVDPQQLATRRLGGEGSELARLRSENRELRRKLKQYEKR